MAKMCPCLWMFGSSTAGTKTAKTKGPVSVAAVPGSKMRMKKSWITPKLLRDFRK